MDQDPNSASSPFTAGFMSGDIDPGQNNKVTTGPFADANGKSQLNVINSNLTDKTKPARWLGCWIAPAA